MSGNELIFGKYEIQHRLAIGGMGEVFYALQRGIPGFERPVILKSLLPDLAAQQSLVDQFLDEARVAATLNHPNVVSIYEVGLWNGTYFIAMEYIRGRNLAQLIRRALESGTEVPPVVAARIIADAAVGLFHAHTATDAQGKPLRIVHRDISPQNIMLRDDGVTKVVDFGIAHASNRSTRTATGTLKGKLAYMAPEQIHSAPVTSLVDQFALGICFWELLVGARLFKADQELELVKRVLEAPIVPPSSRRPAVPPVLDDVVLRMLQREPTQRFESCAQVAAALEEALASLSGPGQQTPAHFMRQLGTDDLQLTAPRSTPAGANFVIPLAPPMDREAPTTTLPDGPAGLKKAAEQSPPPAAAPRARPALLAGVAAVLLALAGGTWAALRPTPPAAPPAPPTPAVVTPALPPVTTPDTTTPVAPPAEAAPTPKPFHLVVTAPVDKVQVRFDGKPVGTAPLELDATPGETHYLQAERPGYRRLEQELSGAAGETQELSLALTKLKAGEPKASPPVAPPSSEPGFLTLETRPWSKVSVDSEYLGSTPLFKRKLPAGRHRLVLVNEGENLQTTRDIVIAPGEVLKLSLVLK